MATKKQKVFSHNGYTVSNGRILKNGLAVDGPEKGFFISPSLSVDNNKMSEDNVLILSNADNGNLNEDISIKSLLSFARTYAKSKGKSLVVSEEIAKKYNIVNFVSGPIGREPNDSIVYPMTVDEMRDATNLLGKGFVLKPSFNRTFNYMNSNTDFGRGATLDLINIPEDIDIKVNLDNAEKNSFKNIRFKLNSISQDGKSGNNYKNVEIESTRNEEVVLSHETNEPIISLPEVSENSSYSLINFNVHVSETGAALLSNKETIKDINKRMLTNIHAAKGISKLESFLSSENAKKDFLRQSEYSLSNIKAEDRKYLGDIFDNIRNIKTLAQEKPKIFSFGIKKNPEEFLEKIDKILEQDTPEMRANFQEIHDKVQKRINALKGISTDMPSLS